MTLSPAQAAILAAGQQHPRHLVAPPARLAPAPRDAIRKSLLAKGLVEPAAVEALDEPPAWAVDGAPAHYRLTEAGLNAARGITSADTSAEASALTSGKPDTPERPQTAQKAQDAAQEPTCAVSAASRRQRLRDAAAAVLAAWDASTDRAGVEEAMTTLRSTLARRTPGQRRLPSAFGKPREGTKREQVLAMLRRPEGATVAQAAEATGWQTHTRCGASSPA